MFVTVIAGVAVFSGVILLLTLALLLAEKKLLPQGKVSLTINDDKQLQVQPQGTLLAALANEGIFVPSACGGGGTCAMCKCKVLTGGGELLPTEQGLVSRKEAKQHVRLACQVKVRNDMAVQVPQSIFAVKRYSATVTSNDNVSTFIKYLNITLDDGQQLDFEAGGYIQIDVPVGEYDFKHFDIPKQYRHEWDTYNLWRYKAQVQEPVFRAYSMANHPAEGNRVSLTVRIAPPPPNRPTAPPGLCSSYIFALKAGDKVQLSGPYGEFFIKDTDREMVYVGGGAGMAPMRSHLFHLFHTLKTKRKVTFFYGARSLKENFFAEEFEAIQQQFPNFKYVLALSDPLPEDNWQGQRGFIHQVARDTYLKDHADPTEVEYYLCGPPVMVDACSEMLTELGVEEEMIAFDAF
ncbi:MAG: NADH:ubiquinone reductase (Na(+)-transporting) subunit F [Myxococcota bacterium]